MILLYFFAILVIFVRRSSFELSPLGVLTTVFLEDMMYLKAGTLVSVTVTNAKSLSSEGVDSGVFVLVSMWQRIGRLFELHLHRLVVYAAVDWTIREIEGLRFFHFSAIFIFCHLHHCLIAHFLHLLPFVLYNGLLARIHQFNQALLSKNRVPSFLFVLVVIPHNFQTGAGLLCFPAFRVEIGGLIIKYVIIG